MKVVRREEQEAREHDLLCEGAAFSDETEGRARSTEPDYLRNEYQRDRDKILHTKSFRRLSHKTQVFLAVEGDHYRTRLTHTLEVAQIARTVARALALNEDLTEAIALGHDLGHTPFGHTGEEAIARKIAQYRGLAPVGFAGPSDADRQGMLFKHNEQSLRVVEVIENGGHGLNLTPEVRNGILCHSGDLRAETLEGRVVGICDRIAYINHDIDDALRAGILSEGSLPESTHHLLGSNHSARIETLVSDLVETSAVKGDIQLSPAIGKAMIELRSFLFDSVYGAPMVRMESEKAVRLVSTLFDYYMQNPQVVPDEYHAISGGDHLRAVIDYVAGMTDRYAKERFESIFVPRSMGFDRPLV